MSRPTKPIPSPAKAKTTTRRGSVAQDAYDHGFVRFLRHRVGGWQPLADALGVKADTIGKILRGGAPLRRTSPTASLG